MILASPFNYKKPGRESKLQSFTVWFSLILFFFGGAFGAIAYMPDLKCIAEFCCAFEWLCIAGGDVQKLNSY